MWRVGALGRRCMLSSQWWKWNILFSTFFVEAHDLSTFRPKAKAAEKKPAGKQHHVSLVHTDLGTTDVGDQEPPQSYGTLFTVNMLNVIPFQINEVKVNSESFAKYMVLDSACQRNCCGPTWFKQHSNLLKSFDMIPNLVECSEQYKFGKGPPSWATQRAYFPSFIGDEPVLLCAALLPDDIPFLGSKSLIRRLGAILNLIDSTVYFDLLGCTVPLYEMNDHIVIKIFDPERAKKSPPSSMRVWQSFSEPSIWKQPDGELILQPALETSTQASVNSRRKTPTTDATASASMDRGMAKPCEHPPELHQEPHREYGQSSTVESPSKRDDQPSLLSTDGFRECASTVRVSSSDRSTIRQPSRKLRQMPHMRRQVEMEQVNREVAPARSWITKLLGTIVAIASTVLDHNHASSYDGIPLQSGSQAEGQSSGFHLFEPSDGGRVDGFQPVHPEFGAPHPGRIHGSPSHHPRGFPAEHGEQQLGVAGLHQRGCLSAKPVADAGKRESTPMESADRVGGHPAGCRQRGGDLRLAGSVKRLKHLWNRSADVLMMEVKSYQTGAPTKSRPPPTVDIMELFAGSAKMSVMAKEYDLVAMQPMDMIYGQDFKDPKTRQKIFQCIDKYKPWLIPMGVDCRLWNIFNCNLNWASRKAQLEELQQDERQLVTFATQVVMKQLKAGRYFLLENPQKSKVWSLEEVEELQSQIGVWQCTLDAGAFGAEIDGQPIIKTMKWLGNQPGLDEALHRRLTPLEREYCTPIEGKMTRPSQEYPDLLCRTILQELRALVHQKEPQRFSPPLHQVLTVAYPTQDLSQWDQLSESIRSSFERSNKRPYYWSPDSPQGQQVCDLLRLDAKKIQVVHTPTTRRFPADDTQWMTRAAFLSFADGTRAVEVEDLSDIQFPRQRFSKAVTFAVFAYGHRRQTTDAHQATEQASSLTIPGLSTDISFKESAQVPTETKRALARLHINLGHPTAQELTRLLAYQGTVTSAIVKAIQNLSCATCERLRPPQQPRPAAMPRLTAGQFGDEVQMDVFYGRTLTGETFGVLGVVDKATGMHQGAIMPDRQAETAFTTFEDMWLRPFGIPIKIHCDPDTSFRGYFQQKMEAMGCVVEHCPPEAHYVIGMVERRNAVLRMTLEKIIDNMAISTIPDAKTALTAACHAVNNMAFARGRSAYQAVFGRTPKLNDDVLTDDTVLASSTQAFKGEEHNPALRAELVRSEAIKALADINASQHLRRALLRKTRNTNIADLQPGQRCAVWRWTKRGAKKRGAWVMARFLSWDPSHVNKQAWIRMGSTTVLATAEQLRTAFGFEHWTPSEEDVQALKSAASSLSQHLLQDERGPAPQDGEAQQALDDIEFPLEPAPITPSMAVVAREPSAPSTPPPRQAPSTSAQPLNIQVHSPTNVYRQQRQSINIYQRFGDEPKAPRTPRGRSRTPPPQQASNQFHLEEHPQHKAAKTSAASHSPRPPLAGSMPGTAEPDQAATAADTPTIPAELPAEPSDAPVGQADTEPVGEAPANQSSLPHEEVATPPDDIKPDEPLPELPQKRPFEAMFTLWAEEDGSFVRSNPAWDGSPFLFYGPPSTKFFEAYATTSQRQEDVRQVGKPAEESDSSQDSDVEEEPKNLQRNKTATMTRKETKQLDREIPWRQIFSMPPAYIDKFLAAINKEAESWAEWQSVRPLTREEAQAVYKDKLLKKRILRSRACYRDKNCGQGELRPKCRIVCLGHQDPDLASLTRNSPTPGRCTEHLLYLMLVAGYNKELFNSDHAWTAWTGDAATAFLQGRQRDSERPLPLFMKPPADGLIELTSHWKAELYQVLGNVYGLSNAPFLWCEEIVQRLKTISYKRHSFDKMLFYKTAYIHGSDEEEVVSLVMVYVDDFIGLHRSDYDITELQKLFRWGDLQKFEEGKDITFKGKTLTLQKNQQGRFTLKISMSKFIEGLDSGSIQRGRLKEDPKLSPSEYQEFRSVSGCLQWAATQARPEIAPVVSLSNHGNDTTIAHLRDLYEALDLLKSTQDAGITIQDVPFNKSSVVLTYTDASWANAQRSGSQIGVVVGITTAAVKEGPVPFALVDWKSGRSARVCRSTLAAEASAADEGADRSAYINMLASELLYCSPAHRLGPRLDFVQATDAKSLYDAVVATNPNLTDKRSLVNVRAIQESVSGNQMHWLPTRLQFADGLTKVSETLRSFFRSWLSKPFAVLAEHPDIEKWLNPQGAKEKVPVTNSVKPNL